MSEKLRLNRRDFVKGLALAVAAIPFAGMFTRGVAAGKDTALPAGQKAVPESDPVASAIGYKEDGKKADIKKYPAAKGKAGVSQKCDNCALYTKTNDGWGKCQMLTSGLVAGAGWCGSWSKKS